LPRAETIGRGRKKKSRKEEERGGGENRALVWLLHG